MGMRNFPGCHKGQGATEYLVLLAVVLIVALVSVALLGFFPGMASDAQITQSQMYWSGASPIAVSEMVARHSTAWHYSFFSMKIKNQGVYPIRITKVLGGSGCVASQIYDGSSVYNVTDYYYLGAGEEVVVGNSRFGGNYRWGVPIVFSDSPGTANCNGTGSLLYLLCAAKTLCQNSNSTPGFLQVNNFGFEYIQYVEGQQITKREIGAEPLLVKCIEPVP